ncbi:DUF6221 family protein [Streptomyces sp. NPDC101224]|uniref:DUF6221 family protein n=2 Tax=unclassified Streptomyces TaxID=2593676 RepID=UPI00382C4D59
MRPPSFQRTVGHVPDQHIRPIGQALIDMLARDCEAMAPTDPRFVGLTYTLRLLAQSYAEHPEYREEWRPYELVRDSGWDMSALLRCLLSR